MTRHQNNNLKSVHNPFFYIVLAAFFCLFASCEKCIPTILCPYQNPQFYSVQGEDTAALYMPNAFTPNGDGINDIFVIFSRNITSYSYQIYSASGRQIFQSSSGQQSIYGFGGWDGTINGKPAPVGIYAVKATATTTFGTPVSLNGTVSIIGGEFFGSNTPPTDGNFDLEIKNAQFPDQNNKGVFDPNLPSGEYLVLDQVHNCR